MIREFIYTSTFLREWKALNFSDDDLRQLETCLLDNPNAGDLIVGTGGLRKLRFAFRNRGKSRSARVCYIDFASYGKTFCLRVYAKNVQTTLTAQEKAKLYDALQRLKDECRRNAEND